MTGSAIKRNIRSILDSDRVELVRFWYLKMGYKVSKDEISKR